MNQVPGPATGPGTGHGSRASVRVLRFTKPLSEGSGHVMSPRALHQHFPGHYSGTTTILRPTPDANCSSASG